jgi:hypothetical protein
MLPRKKLSTTIGASNYNAYLHRMVKAAIQRSFDPDSPAS